MAKNKRVALTLSPEVDDVLTELSGLLGQPKTALITEILVDALPTFRGITQAIKQAKDGQKEQALETASKFLQDASQSLNQAHMDFGGMKVKHGK